MAWLELWLLQVLLAAVASAFVWFRSISIAHCGESCDFQLLANTIWAFFWACLALVVVSGALTVLLRHRRWSWGIPVTGMTFTVAAWIIAYRITDIALLF